VVVVLPSCCFYFFRCSFTCSCQVALKLFAFAFGSCLLLLLVMLSLLLLLLCDDVAVATVAAVDCRTLFAVIHFI